MTPNLKQQAQQLAARVDALSVRERAMVFGAACALVAFVGNTFVLAPQRATQDALRAQIDEQQASLGGADGEIAARVQAFQLDPDAPARARLDSLRKEISQLGHELLAIEHGLVPPERMSPLVDGILRANGRLKLVSMRTLPVEPVAGPGAGAAGTTPSNAPAATPEPASADGAATPPSTEESAPLLYRHGVEVTVRGNYLDMVDYMSALEALPTRMFWGRARLDVEAYPSARLTLTLHTLSLDRQWMKL